MRAKRVDSNHAEIKHAIEAAGYIVKDTHEFPGMLDLQVRSKSGLIVPVEIKSPGGRVTKAEREYLDTMGGIVVYSAEDALDYLAMVDSGEAVAWRLLRANPKLRDKAIELLDEDNKPDICPDCAGELAGDYFSDDGMMVCQRCEGRGTV